MIIASIVVVVCVFFLALFVAPDDVQVLPGGRLAFAVAFAWWAACLILMAGLGYVAVHFINKYW